MTEQQSQMIGVDAESAESDVGFGDVESLDLERYWETTREWEEAVEDLPEVKTGIRTVRSGHVLLYMEC